MSESKRKVSARAVAIRPEEPEERVFEMPKPERNLVTVGQLLLAFGVVMADPTKRSAIQQINSCEIDAIRSAEFLCVIDEVQAKFEKCVQAWNRASEEDRVTKVFNAPITLQFSPFDLVGLLKSSSISGEALRQLQPWLIRREAPKIVVDNDIDLENIKEWLGKYDA